MEPRTPADPRNSTEGVGDQFRRAVRMSARSGPRGVAFFLGAAWRLWRAERRRRSSMRRFGCLVPPVVAISPTMRCNYSCAGCYSRGRSSEDELTTAELDRLLAEAETLGVLAVVFTGGEPLTRADLVGLMARHARLVFVLITNGSLVTEGVARRVAQSGNVVTLLSLEGHEAQTDVRRRAGAHAAVLRAMERLSDAGACFGFSATVTAANAERLVSDEFVDGMARLGCVVGYYNEHVPCGPDPHPEWTPTPEARRRFRARVLELRRTKPMVLTHFPDDEYGAANRCSGAGRSSLHVNSQGGIEPCPFASFSCESVREVGLLGACRSRFLSAIREHPPLLARDRLPCALYEHRGEIEELRREIAGRR